MLCVKKVACTLKVSVSWALLPLLTDHRLNLATRSSGSWRTKVAAALSYNHASTWTGLHLTRKCFSLFSIDFTKESSMTPGTMPLAEESWSVSCFRAPWKLQLISLPLTSSCVESAEGYRYVILEDPIQLALNRGEYGPSMLRDFRTKRYIGASFSKSVQKSLVGLKILVRDQMQTRSGGSGNVIEHGLRSKLLRSFRANGLALCVFKDWIRWMCCHGNGLIAMSA